MIFSLFLLIIINNYKMSYLYKSNNFNKFRSIDISSIDITSIDISKITKKIN